MLKDKAYNLKILKKFINNKNIIIPDFYSFSLNEYLIKKNKIITKISRQIKKNNLILRSSSVDEDGKAISNAGRYNSKIIKQNSSLEIIKKYLDDFIEQFKTKQDIIIVQNFINNVDLSGVIFTKDNNTNAPYFLINYDDSGKTDLVTSGRKSENHKQLIVYKNLKTKNKFSKLIELSKYLEKKIKNDRLDIEFSIKGNKLYIFQIRYLPLGRSSQNNYPYDHDEILINIKKKLLKLLSRNPTLSGKKTIFSNMADWNPAEMLGEKPNTLALSLYKDLISDETWRIQRKNYGYSDVFPNILIFSFGGVPYVDIRTDINSFLPKDINNDLKEIICNKYLSYLSKNPHLHDKIEFEVVETCFSVNSETRLSRIFNKKIVNNYLKSLNKLTKNIFKEKYLYKDITKIQKFEKKINIKNSDKDYLQNIFFINKITKEYGTLPFAGIARCAFIAQRILIDLKENYLISDEEFENFFKNIRSVTDEIKKDHRNLVSNRISKSNFLKKYGHLRPHTYEINSKNYREGYKLYFSSNIPNTKRKNPNKINFTKHKKINQFFTKELNISFSVFLEFAKKSIYWREKSKFLFTIGIDKIFTNLVNLSKVININRSDLTYIDIKNILNFFSKLENDKLSNSIKTEIIKNKREILALKNVKLPEFILSYKNIYSYYESKSKINFVTRSETSGDVVIIKDNHKKISSLKNKIVMIENADPGYDYIFNYSIKGLITKYGGSNSHMAIRCLENNIPACIGIGVVNFENVMKSKKVIIDCNNKILRAL